MRCTVHDCESLRNWFDMSWYNDPLLKNSRHILIKDVQRNMMIGAYEHEKSAAQPVVINVELFINTKNEGDDLGNAYNYDEVIETIDGILSEGHICLQETLVDLIAERLLRNPLLIAVVVRSEKTQAYPGVKSAGVEIFKVRHDR